MKYLKFLVNIHNWFEICIKSMCFFRFLMSKNNQERGHCYKKSADPDEWNSPTNSQNFKMCKILISYINGYMWNLENWYRWTYLQGRSRHRCGEQTWAHRKEARMWWIGRLDLPNVYCHVWNRWLMGSRCMVQGAQPQCSAVTSMGRVMRGGERKAMYVYI